MADGDVIFMEGFDWANTPTGTINGLSARWSNVGGSMSLVAGRFGGRALQQPAGNSSGAFSPYFTAITSFTLCMSISLTSSDNSTGWAMCSGSSQHLNYRVHNTNDVELRIGATNIGYFTLTIGTWMTLEIELEWHASAGRVTVYRNGAQVLNVTGINTTGGLSSVNNFRFNPDAASVAPGRYDDFVIYQGSSKPARAAFINTISVDADGGTLDWVPSTGSDHYAMLDDLPLGTGDYVSGTTVGDIDILNVGSLSSDEDILAVQIAAIALKTDGNTRGITVSPTVGSTEDDYPETILNTTASYISRLYNLSPDTSLAWTKTELEAASVKVEVTT